MYMYYAKLVRVIDGDTVVVDADLGFNIVWKNLHVRLLNVNAPEPHTLTREIGEIWTEQLQEILRDKKELILISHELDNFGRSLGVLLADGINVNEEINKHFVSEG